MNRLEGAGALETGASAAVHALQQLAPVMPFFPWTSPPARDLLFSQLRTGRIPSADRAEPT
jgi:hypothetical protein